MTQLTWREAERIELVPGYGLEDAEGRTVEAVGPARVACEGGFLHVALTGVPAVQVVSAPAVRRVVLSTSAADSPSDE
jgi:hypothetical protein